jgi:NADH dehydrogenase FAD-containing subunit
VTDRRHVVVVGGGFAGLNAARKLSDLAGVRVTVVDRTNHHLFQPLLYQVATAAIDPADIAAPIRSILSGRRNLEVVLGEVARIEVNGRQVHLVDGTALDYDWLVLAPGVRHSYYAHPEWEALAPGLKTVEDALEIRRRVLLAFERAERATSAEERHRHLTFVVVGGGPTGVEVAGAIAEIKKHALTRDFRHIDPRDASVLLIEGGPRILPSYPPELSQKAKEILRELGVDVRTDALVTAIEPGAVSSVGWRIPTDSVIWAAGNAGSPLLGHLACRSTGWAGLECCRTAASRVIPRCSCWATPRPSPTTSDSAGGYRQSHRWRCSRAATWQRRSRPGWQEPAPVPVQRQPAGGDRPQQGVANVGQSTRRILRLVHLVFIIFYLIGSPTGCWC